MKTPEQCHSCGGFGGKGHTCPPSITPDRYSAIYPTLCEVAKKNGYALAKHGSMKRDFDLIAAPWADVATSAETLIAEIIKVSNGFIKDIDKDLLPYKRPHGRLGWAIHLGGGPYLDISVMPRIDSPPTNQIGETMIHTSERAGSGQYGICGKCNSGPTKEGHDGCLGTLPGPIMNACCGHGEAGIAYIQYWGENGSGGKRISGDEAITEQARLIRLTPGS